MYQGPPKPLKSQVPTKTSCFSGKHDVLHFPYFCNLVSSWISLNFHPLKSFNILTQFACMSRIYRYHPQGGLLFLDIAHSAWCPCCSNEWPHGSVKYKSKSLWKLAMMCLKHCSFSSCHKSEMMSPYASNFEFQKSEIKGLKKMLEGILLGTLDTHLFRTGFMGFLRFFTGFLRVRKTRCFFETQCLQNPLRVFYGLLRVFYGLPEIQQLGAIFSKKKRTISMWHCKNPIQTIHGAFVYTSSHAGRLGCGSKVTNWK